MDTTITLELGEGEWEYLRQVLPAIQWLCESMGTRAVQMPLGTAGPPERYHVSSTGALLPHSNSTECSLCELESGATESLEESSGGI